VKTNRLRYTRQMIRRPEDLPQKAIWIARPQGTRRQGRPKSRWADPWGPRLDEAQDIEQSKDLLRQTLTANWFYKIASCIEGILSQSTHSGITTSKETPKSYLSGMQSYKWCRSIISWRSVWIKQCSLSCLLLNQAR
jgi:hypothetical protein